MLRLQADPEALAPESLLVFKVNGAVPEFVKAVRRVPGLDWVDEQEWHDAEDETAAVYLLVPDQRALQQILSLWALWQADRDLGVGNTPWRDVFDRLKELRRWGPEDRISPEDKGILEEISEDLSEEESVRIEVELVFRPTEQEASIAQTSFVIRLRERGGNLITSRRIAPIAYHGLLVEIPARELKAILSQEETSLRGANEVMHIRPQSLGNGIETTDITAADFSTPPAADRPPILALLDGAVVSGHPLLVGRTDGIDLFTLEERTPVRERKHGTAMASLIVHGDLNSPGSSPLPRRIVTVPVMEFDGRNEGLPTERLAIDLVYEAVLHLRQQTDADILIINLSLGNSRRPFHGQMSPWARLLDWLAWEHGILFVVAAGNDGGFIPIRGYATGNALEDDRSDNRPKAVLEAVDAKKAERRILSPAETVNGITVGALNHDDVPAGAPMPAGSLFHAYPGLSLSNPSSRLGPGFGNATKPDILMPGGREHLAVTRSGIIGATPSIPRAAFGLRVAAPPTDTNPAAVGASGATSGATALASRTAHRIHDALEANYGEQFLQLSKRQRALVLKALLVHPAAWDDATAAYIKGVVGPADNRQHIRQKDNIRRYLGYGAVDPDVAVACAADRATFWATGEIGPEQALRVEVPIPACMGGQALPHALSATLAWFAPIRPGNQRYRAVRLRIVKPEDLDSLALAGDSGQPDDNQAHRGTTISRWWTGVRAPAVTPDMTCPIVIQREPDLPGFEDDPIPFGMAVTLQMPGVVQIYEQVRQRLGVRAPVPAS